MELTTEDRKRIEQEANNYVRLMNWGYHKEAKDDFRKGAEYATRYEREQWKEWRAEAEAKLIEYGKFVSDVEAERSELRNKVIDECIEKLWDNGFGPGDAETKLQELESQMIHKLLNSLKTK